MNGNEVLTNAQFRGFVQRLVVLASLALFLAMNCSCAPDGSSPAQETCPQPKNHLSFRNRPPSKKIPVIFDTDIGDDIDDTWALALLLQSPEFDIKLITTAVGDTLARTKVVVKAFCQPVRTNYVRQGANYSL